MKILFICRHNRFRSQVAESYFRKINKNKNIKSCSAGISTGKPIAETVKKVAKKLGFKVSGISKPIRERLLKEMDLMIIVADNIHPSFLSGEVKKIVVWKVPDTSQSNEKRIEEIIKIIIKKVEKLNKELETKIKKKK